MKRPAIVAALLAGILAVLFVASGYAGPKRVARRQPATKSAATKQKAKSKAGQPAKKESAPAPPARLTSEKAPLKELFRGWTKPKITLVFSGDIAGYIEPCGCTGRENQKGGLQRRHSFLKKLSADGWNPVAFDVGGFLSRSGEQSFLKLETAVKSLKAMGYQAMTFGKIDWSFDAPRKFSIISEVNPDEAEGDRPFIAANVAVFKSDVPPRFRIFEAAGYKIGVTSVLGDSFHDAVAATVDTEDLGLTKAAEALASVVPELKDCDLKILLSHASPDESRALAAKFPQFQYVATASGGADEPPLELEMLAGKKTRLVEVGKKGMYVIAIGLFDDPKKPVRYEVVPLDSRWEDSPEMVALMTEYQEKLQIGGWEALQLSREPHPRSELLGEFVGSAACKDCHEEEYKIWEGSKHFHATESLAHLTPSRHFDPECISCHATGWKPQAFSPLAGGYDGLKTTPHLTGNGCENCHGPGGAHVAAENSADDQKLQDTLRTALHLDKHKARNDVCIKCHDGDNDPFFGHPDEDGNDTYLTKYWAEIAH